MKRRLWTHSICTLAAAFGIVAHARAEDLDKTALPGLVAEYFSLPEVKGFDDVKAGTKPTMVRIDKQVDFESVDGEFYGIKLKDNFIAHWSGILRVEKAGAYTLGASSDDGSRITIDGKVVVDNGGIHGMGEKTGNIELAAGDHPIRIEFYQVAGGAGCKISWQSAAVEKQAIPASALFHKVDSDKIEWDRAAWEKLAKTKPVPKGPARKKMDKKAAEMDYGPFLAVTLGAGQSSNIAYKGIIVKVDKEKNANICFDTEMMRVSAAWIGNGLSLAGRPFADDSNDYSIVDGPLEFSTQVRPGWSKDTERADPRPPKDPNAPKDGPLPAEWAKYRGLFIHGDKVVFSYTVGATPVLEMPGAKVSGETVAYTRTFNIPTTDKPLELLVTDAGAAIEAIAPDEKTVTIKSADSALCVGIVGTLNGCKWEAAGTSLYLKIPKLNAAAAFTLVLAKLPLDKTGSFPAMLAGGAEDLTPYTKGGPPRWTETVTTKGTLSTDATSPYVIDTLTAPEVNPYKSWLRFTALDFFKDGRAAVTTWNGDVWIVSGINEKLENLTWKRYATGLFGPMGLKIVDDVVYVNGRDQITKLRDLNNDGEADLYENFNNDCFLTPNFHEYCFDLQTDKEGNFYYTKGSAIWAGSLRMSAHAGSVIKVAKDGSQLEILANGLRAPNGLAIGPNGEITCSDNQGNWTPECPINWIKKGAYYGWVGSGQTAKEREKPLCWIPYNIDKSTSGQVWVDNDKWGPFKGQMMATSYDCSISHVIIEHIGDDVQGGIVKFPWAFPSGLMRGRFSPTDGQLYVCGLRGWSSRAAKECILQRIRYTGKPVNMVLDARTTKTGMEVTFTSLLDPASVDLQNISAEWFSVTRSGNYGSGESGVIDPKKKGREEVEIKSARLAADGKTIALEIPTLRPVTNLVLKFKLKAADGAPLSQELDYTINRLP